MSLSYLDRAEPFAAARHAMQMVADRCGETVHVAVLSEREVIYMFRYRQRMNETASLADQRWPFHKRWGEVCALMRIA